MKRVIISDGHSHIIFRRQFRWLWIWWTAEKRWYYASDENFRLKTSIEKAERAGYTIIDKRRKK